MTGHAWHRAVRFLGALAAAIPCLYLSWALFGTWADPLSRGDGSWVRFGVGLMILEFIVLHSGVFMAAILGMEAGPVKRVGWMLGLAVFYGLMAWGFSVATDSPALLGIFAAVVAGRLITAMTDRQEGFTATMARSAIGVTLYIGIVFCTVFLPIPEWGITSAIVADVYPDRGSGLWERQPQRAVAGAAFYFLVMGLLELWLPIRRARIPASGQFASRFTQGDRS